MEISTVVFSTTDGMMTQTCWVVTDAAVVDRIRGLLGDPVCETMLDGAAVAAIGKAGDENGAVVMFTDG